MNQFGFCAADHGLAIALDTGSFRVIRDSFESNFLATDGEVRFSFECFFFRCPFNFDDPEDLTENEHTKLAELAKLNSPLLNCYVMADELRHLWKLGTRGQVIALVMDWIHRATHSKIKPLVDFAKNLRNYVSGIISSADHKINTSVLEGVNNKIKQVKRRAYGFRDDNYFFLKVKAAFPGLP